MRLPSGEITRRPLLGFMVATLAGLGVALGCWPASTLRSLEATTWAQRVRWTARPSPVSDKIKLIVVDDRSLQWVTAQYPDVTWPWPRTYFGAILDFCRRGGVKSVGFDILFTEPSAHQDDEEFKKSLEALPGKVFLASNFQNGAFTDPTPILRAEGVGFGHVNASFDGDEGMILRVRPQIEGRKLLGLMGGIGDLDCPLNEKDEMVLKFAGPFGVHEAIPACEIIGSELSLQNGEKPLWDPLHFKDTHVLVGYKAGGLHDLRPTPFSDVVPGVEIHATALDNLLEGLERGDGTVACAREAGRSLQIQLVLLSSLLGGAVVFMKRTRSEFLTGVGSISCPLALAVCGAFQDLWLPLVAPLSGSLASMTAALGWKYVNEGRQRRFLKTAFSQYLSPEIVRRLADDPGALKLGGTQRVLTMFFSDLKGFSTFSEKMDPQTLTRFLNGFLTEMTGIILEEGGTLDKYVGDAIIAFWNAPLTQEDHAERAVRAAHRCHARIRELNPGYKAEFGVELLLRVGLNTAQVVVGNMGSAQRFSYTMFGDGANLASRLEGANKGFGTLLMISEATAQALNGRYFLRELGRIRVPGRSQAVKVFEPQASSEASPVVQQYVQALALLNQGKVSEARDLFASLPGDSPSRVYRKRCEEILSGRLASWDGVWDLKEK